MSDTRDDLLRRIRALQEKTVAAGCSEAEALAAANLAARLIDKYGFTMTEVEAKAEPVSEDTWISKSVSMKEVYFTLKALEEYCDCQCLTSSTWVDGKRKSILLVIGKEPDRAMMHYMLNLLASAFGYEWRQYAKTIPEVRRHSMQIKKSFGVGMGRRISERLRQMKAERNAYIDPNSGRTGQALVVVKNAMVLEKVAVLHPHIRTTKRKGASDGSAYWAGRSAAENVALSTGIGTNAAPRLK